MSRTALLSVAVIVILSAQVSEAGGFRCRGVQYCGPVVCCDLPCGGITPVPDIVIPGPDDDDIIIPGPEDDIIIPGPEDSMGMRTWIYGRRPQLVMGKYHGVERGNVKLQKRTGEFVRIPVQELSSLDQRIVVGQIAAVQRTWTDSSQQFTRRARFSRTERNIVVLKSANGREITVPFARLSSADRTLVKLLSPTVVEDHLPTPGRAQLAKN